VRCVTRLGSADWAGRVAGHRRAARSQLWSSSAAPGPSWGLRARLRRAVPRSASGSTGPTWGWVSVAAALNHAGWDARPSVLRSRCGAPILV